MQSNRVMVDFDSTLNDFDGHLLRTLNEQFGSNYVLGDIKTWDFIREMDPEHVQHTWGENVYYSRNWTLSIPPLPGAVLAMNRLRDAGWYVRVVTARDGVMLDWVKQWLRNEGLGWIGVSCTDKKAEWVERYGYAVAIDDAPHHVLNLQSTSLDRVYMIDKPYNSHIVEERTFGKVIRVHSLWMAVEDLTSDRRVQGEPAADVQSQPAAGV
jgi:hypothetical protein